MNKRAPDPGRTLDPPNPQCRRLALILLLTMVVSGCMIEDHSVRPDPVLPVATAQQPSKTRPNQLASRDRAIDPEARRTLGTGTNRLLPMPEPLRAKPATPAIPVFLARPVEPLARIVPLVASVDAPGERSDGEVGRAGLNASGDRGATRPVAETPVFSGEESQGLAAIPAGETPESIPQATPPQPIDLPAALRLADQQNPAIGEARVLILAALASRQQAYSLLLPTLNAGTNYHDHVGVLERASGTILPVTEQSLYVGAGARTIGSDTVNIPGVNIFSPLTDAIFEPLAAQQRVRGAQANAANAANVTLLEVARLYFRLLGSQAQYEARRVTAREADQLAASVLAFSQTGEGRRSDAERAETDRRLFQTDILRAEELMAVTSAQLAEQLNLDASSRLQPMTGTIEPVELIDPNTPIDDLLQAALARRPDLENRRALVAEATFQTQREKFRPFLPTIWISFSGGAFGGGSNLVPPTFSSFAGRTDFDARAYWTVLNFGAGNAALIKQRKAIAAQAMASEYRVVNEIRAQVMSARSQSIAFKNRIATAEARLRSASDGFAQDQARLRETLAKPIEALDSLRLLAEARIALIEAITEFNQTQFELFVALGAPPPL